MFKIWKQVNVRLKHIFINRKETILIIYLQLEAKEGK
jgi:hypothetical protein